MKTLSSLDTLAFRVKVKTERPMERKLVLEHIEVTVVAAEDVNLDEPEGYRPEDVGHEMFYGTGREHTIEVDKDAFDNVEVGSALFYELKRVVEDAVV